MYVHTAGGDRDLGLNGGTAAWVQIVLTLHSVNGSVSAAKKLLGSWNTDPDPSVSETPNGSSFVISQAVAIPPDTSWIWIAVDAHAFAFAQGPRTNLGQGFAQIELRDKITSPATTDMGYYTPPIKIRVQQVAARLCTGLLRM